MVENANDVFMDVVEKSVNATKDGSANNATNRAIAMVMVRVFSTGKKQDVFAPKVIMETIATMDVANAMVNALSTMTRKLPFVNASKAFVENIANSNVQAIAMVMEYVPKMPHANASIRTIPRRAIVPMPCATVGYATVIDANAKAILMDNFVPNAKKTGTVHNAMLTVTNTYAKVDACIMMAFDAYAKAIPKWYTMEFVHFILRSTQTVSIPHAKSVQRDIILLMRCL